MTRDNYMCVSEFYKWYVRKNQNITKKINIIEDYIGNDMGINSIALKYNVSTSTVNRCLAIYFKKSLTPITLPSAV